MLGKQNDRLDLPKTLDRHKKYTERLRSQMLCCQNEIWKDQPDLQYLALNFCNASCNDVLPYQKD